MSGIYIHIPFCKQKCTYCDFYTVVAPSLIPSVVDGISKEIILRKDYLTDKKISTIYFGGGTPSILSKEQFEQILSPVYHFFDVEETAEITFEANPDDLTDDFFKQIAGLPFNRISIGIQSFKDEDLKKINRRHDGIQAKEAVQRARKYGFNNISIDLIYGLPGQNLEDWNHQLEQAMRLNAEHISSYGLTYEEGTVLWKQRSKGLVHTTEDEVMIQMFETMLLSMSNKGYEMYEVSNFSKPGYRSKHNSAYWKMIPYLGVGPSAHSYDGKSRQWNVSSNKKYLENLGPEGNYFDKEILDMNDQYNDYVMVTLRTVEGISLDDLKSRFGQKMHDYCMKSASPFLSNQEMELEKNYLRLSTSGFLVANMIISTLFQVE